jgi:hypothetical protein
MNCTRVSVAATMCELSRRKAKLVTRHLSVGTGWLTFSVCVSILWSAVANASPQRQWLGARPVERSLVLPHGWSEVSVSWDHHRADGGFGLDGSRADWIRPMHMEAFTTALRFGLVPRVEAFSSVETVRLAADEEIRVGIGGANLGTRVELWASALPLSSLTAEVAYQLPIGTNVPSTTRAEAPTGGELAVGTGASQFLRCAFGHSLALFGLKPVWSVMFRCRHAWVHRATAQTGETGLGWMERVWFRLAL